MGTSNKARSWYITLVVQPRCCNFGQAHICVRTHLPYLSWEKNSDRCIDTDRHTCTLYTHTIQCTVGTGQLNRCHKKCHKSNNWRSLKGQLPVIQTKLTFKTSSIVTLETFFVASIELSCPYSTVHTHACILYTHTGLQTLSTQTWGARSGLNTRACHHEAMFFLKS